MPSARAGEAANGAARIGFHEAGDGPRICLLPSVGRGCDDLTALAGELVALGYAVVLPDPRGIGRSVGPLEGLALPDLAADVAAVIAACGGRAIVGGHAYGSIVARAVAAGWPDLVRGVALLAAGARDTPADLGRVIDRLAGAEGPAEARRAGLLRTFLASDARAEAWLSGWFPDVLAAQRAARAATPPGEWWAAGTAPVLDLIAAEDPFRPAATHSDLARALGTRVTVKVIAGARHALPDEKAAETAAALAEWARRLP